MNTLIKYGKKFCGKYQKHTLLFKKAVYFFLNKHKDKSFKDVEKMFVEEFEPEFDVESVEFNDLKTFFREIALYEYTTNFKYFEENIDFFYKVANDDKP